MLIVRESIMGAGISRKSMIKRAYLLLATLAPSVIRCLLVTTKELIVCQCLNIDSLNCSKETSVLFKTSLTPDRVFPLLTASPLFPIVWPPTIKHLPPYQPYQHSSPYRIQRHLKPIPFQPKPCISQHSFPPHHHPLHNPCLRRPTRLRHLPSGLRGGRDGLLQRCG